MLTQGMRFGDPAAKDVVIQITGGQENGFLQREYEQICAITERKDFRLLTFQVTDWNNDLSPWEAPAVFGDEGFGGGAHGLAAASHRVGAARREVPGG